MYVPSKHIHSVHLYLGVPTYIPSLEFILIVIPR